jgi:hypothetical protein
MRNEHIIFAIFIIISIAYIHGRFIADFKISNEGIEESRA